MNKLYLAALQMIPGIGATRTRQLFDFFGSAQQVWQADEKDLLSSGCLDRNTCSKLLVQRKNINIHTAVRQWEKQGIQICSIDDAEYPFLLRNIYNPPMVLFYRGRLPEVKNIIAIVGARQASAYGRNAARMLSAELAQAGFCIVSGAARGIDTAAHTGALTKGSTVAVLGCGVDVNYPPENGRLLAEIAEKGAVISEYAPGTMAHPGHFPARNRIINGMSQGVIVVEAAEKSGALITADYALEEGRDVFAVPGSIFSSQSKGTHRLIKQGAKIIDSADDVLEEYHLQPEDRRNKKAELSLTDEEKNVYAVLSYDTPLGIEEIILKTNGLPTTITYILLQLELRGLVTECSGQCYVRAAGEGVS
ncbi:MAG: DNA-processing protein DprA [Veillonellales bacterium]